MDDLKHNYYQHLKKLNPVLESTYIAARKYYEAEILSLLPQDREALILDVGCGFGHLLRFLLENGYHNCGGIELDHQLYLECCNHVGEQVAFVENDSIENFLKDRINCFKVILATDVIEHFTFDQALSLIILMRNALTTGGRVIFRTPNMANLFASYSRYMDVTHQIGFTEQSLAQLLNQGGFYEAQLHCPDWRRHPLRLKIRLSAQIHRWLFYLQDRSPALCFDKNIIMWATKQ